MATIATANRNMCQFKIILVAILVIAQVKLFAQSTELQGTVNLGPMAHVYKVLTIPNCPQTYTPPSGTTATTIKHETTYSNGKTNITVESVVNPSVPTIILANKILRIPITPNSSGKANFYLDDKDKSILYVNYWLNGSYTIPSGTVIREYTPLYSCAGVPTMTLKKTRTLIADTSVLFRKVMPGSAEMSTTWFANSEQISVLNPSGTVAYYLVNRYDRNSKYILELQNREHLPYNSQSLDFGALIIPIKYRYALNKNNTEVKSDVAASFNIGVYAGYKLTRYSIINKAGTYTNRSRISFRVGPFLNLSSTALDATSTSASVTPLAKDVKQNIAVLSTGLGLMGDVRGVQIGIYGGWDYGMGSEAVNWNYNKQFWLGFGAGYKITDLFAQKD